MKGLLLILLIAAMAGGCASQEQQKYNGWYAPGSTREQIITHYGEPVWTIERPSANPTDDEWRAALAPKGPWMHPTILVDYIKDVEKQSGAKVARFDAFSVTDHRSFLERLDIMGNSLDLVYYDPQSRVLTSKPLPYYAYGD